MKKGIHPQYKDFKIKVGKDEFTTKSTHPDGVLLMDIDFREHYAWGNKSMVSSNTSKKASEFNSKYNGLDFGL
jgi:ribosomal protein L31